MLEELHVRNYALIDALSVSFGGGFCVLTGETGAGKSILIGALGFILGGKADSDVIRTGKDEAEVSGVFRVEGNGDALAWLEEREIASDDGCVVIRRILRRAGRGSAFIQSTPVSLSDIQTFTGFLVDIHGQHEHQSLFSTDNHRRFLDRYAGLSDRVHAFTEKFTELSELRKSLDALVASERERLREEELLAFAVDEIDKAGMRPGEEEELLRERKLLMEHEKLFSFVNDAATALADYRGGSLGLARKSVGGAAVIDESLKDLERRLDNSFFELEDVAEALKKYQAGKEFDPERLEACEERLALIHRLEKKYGSSVKEMLDYRAEAGKKLEGIRNFDEEKNALEERVRDAEQALLAEAEAVSDERKRAALEIEGEIEKALRDLGMKRIVFKVLIERKESPRGGTLCGPAGLDAVSFLISPNPGEPLKALKTIASGGEISRVMLAIKTILAESDDVRCLVFDEIDAGIGGEVAVAVGAFLRRLGGFKQVLCITHLASIAAQADRHLRVEKNVDKERTYTDIKSIEGIERVREIARMLSGEPEGAASLSHAEELLKKFETR